jgi:hypothetical protein
MVSLAKVGVGGSEVLVAGSVTNVFNKDVGVGEKSITGVAVGTGMKTSGTTVTTSGAGEGEMAVGTPP